MRGRRGAALLLALGIMGLWGITPAPADDRGIPQSVEELLQIYGIGNEPADYVVVVDTSSSMEDPPPVYPTVRDVYGSFTTAIGDHDHLAVITFDTDAVTRFNGALDTPTSRTSAVGALPPSARGTGTDIGAAMDAALARMERPDGAPVQTLIFLTDGQILAPRSPYASRGSQAWKQLADRATKLSTSRSVSVYGAGLGGKTTDIGVLKDVFPRATIVSVPTDQLAGFFAEAVQRARVERLRQPVEQELNRNAIQVVVTAGELRDTTTMTIRFESKLPHLGATISVKDLTVTDAEGHRLKASLVGGPQTVTVGPGRTSDVITATVQVPGLSHDVRIGAVPETRDFTVGLDAALEVEPAGILVRDLGIATSPQLVIPDSVTSTRQHGIAYWMLGAAAAVLALIAALLWWCYRRFLAVPQLRGGVEMKDGTIYWFRGKEQTIPDRRISFDGAGNSVVIFTKRGKYTHTFSTRQPRLWVRSKDGTAQVYSYGAPVLLTTPVVIGTTDCITLGPTTVTVIADDQKGI